MIPLSTWVRYKQYARGRYSDKDNVPHMVHNYVDPKHKIIGAVAGTSMGNKHVTHCLM